MNIHKGETGGSIPGRTPLYSCHTPFFGEGANRFPRLSSVIPIIPRVSVSSVYLYGVFHQVHPQASSPFPKDPKREWSHPPVRGSVVSSSFPGTSARIGYTFLHVRPVELSAQHTPEMHVSFNVSHFLVPHGTDAVL